MRIKGVDKVKKWRSLVNLLLQFEILYDVWSSKGRRADTCEILGLFFVEEFLAFYAHEFYSYTQYSVILHICRR